MRTVTRHAGKPFDRKAFGEALRGSPGARGIDRQEAPNLGASKTLVELGIQPTQFGVGYNDAEGEARERLNLTPGPSPFSSTKTTPADSRAAWIFSIASADAAGRPAPSARFTVIVESPVI